MERTTAATTAGPRPRADALRNRERIIDAARELAVQYGADAPLDEVARRAGVGNATLYRHFHDRSVLMRQVVLSVIERAAGHAERAAAEEDDPFEAVSRFAHAAVDERVGALCAMFSAGFNPYHPDLVQARERFDTAVDALMERARRAGQLRADSETGDLMVALSQLTRPLPGTTCPANDRFVHRHIQLLLDGLRAPARSTLQGSAVTLEDLRAAR